jgi:hypothetical protein
MRTRPAGPHLPLTPPPPQVSLIARAHQLVMDGYKWMFHDQLVTVWSAPNYCYRCGNIAAILELDEHLTKNFKVFEAAPQEARGAQSKRATPEYFLVGQRGGGWRRGERAGRWCRAEPRLAWWLFALAASVALTLALPPPPPPPALPPPRSERRVPLQHGHSCRRRRSSSSRAPRGRSCAGGSPSPLAPLDGLGSHALFVLFSVHVGCSLFHALLRGCAPE